MPNFTQCASTLMNVVNDLNEKQDPRLGRYFKVKFSGNTDDNETMVIFNLNTTEYNVNERRREIEDVLYDHLEKFITEVKKEFKKRCGVVLTLSDKKQDITYNAINYAGEYMVTIHISYTCKLIKE